MSVLRDPVNHQKNSDTQEYGRVLSDDDIVDTEMMTSENCWDEEDKTDGADGGLLSAKTSVASAVFSFVCTTIGTGVLALPSALVFVGWTGVLLIIVITVICRHTANYLVQCQFSCPPRLLHTYEEIGEAALGAWGRRMVAVCQCTSLFGVCAIFLVLIGKNVHTLVPSVGYHVWLLVFGFGLIPVSWIKRMREISVLAYFGVFASIFVAAFVMVKGTLDGAQNKPQPDYDTFNIGGLSEAFNVIVFSFGGHSVLPGIVSEMKAPFAGYRSMTFWSYSTIGFVYSAVAAAGYYAFGTKASDNVLLDFDADSPIVKLSIAVITAHILFAYPIPLNPVALYIEDALDIKVSSIGPSRELFYRIILRTTLVLFTMLIATCVPYFGDMLSLVSALTIVAVAFIFPPWFYYLLYRDTVLFSLGHLALMFVIVAVGLAGTAAGLYYAVNNLVQDSKTNPFDDFWNQ